MKIGVGQRAFASLRVVEREVGKTQAGPLAWRLGSITETGYTLKPGFPYLVNIPGDCTIAFCNDDIRRGDVLIVHEPAEFDE
jgi:hypothetical protein